MKNFFIAILMIFSINVNATPWTDRKNIDEMSGSHEYKKFKKSLNGSSMLHIQISGYGEGNNNLVWISDEDTIYLLSDLEALRINLDSIRYWVLGKVSIKNRKQFIFYYMCKASDVVEFECLDDSEDGQIRRQELVQKILQAKEIKIELPSYPSGSRIRVFR